MEQSSTLFKKFLWGNVFVLAAMILMMPLKSFAQEYAGPVTVEYEATCAFKECFKKNNNYNRQNIFGAYLFHDDVEWTISINGRIYTNVSIDQIQPNKGYTIENTQLVCMAVNQLKSDFAMDEILLICESLVNNIKNVNKIN